MEEDMVQTPQEAPLEPMEDQMLQQQVKVIGLLGPGEGLIEVWEQTDILRVWMPFAGNVLEATNNVLGLIGGSVIENDQAVWRAGLRRDRLQSGLQISFPVVNRNDRYQAARAAIGLGKGHGSSVIRSDWRTGSCIQVDLQVGQRDGLW